MRRLVRSFIALFACWLLLSMGGCSTFRTLSEAKPGEPKVFSGTRLDIRTIKNRDGEIGDLEVEPVEYPMLDLPFSFMLDVLLLPYTTSAVIYDKLFHR